MTRFLFATVLLILTACNPQGGATPAVQRAATDAALLVTGVSSIEKSFVTLYPGALTPAELAGVDAALAAAQVALGQLSTLANTAPTGNALMAVETNINAVVSIMSQVVAKVPNIPPSVAAGLMAANVLLPIIETTANQLIAGSTVAPAPKAAMGITMAPDHARLVLQAAGAH
jgi:hypothetical protein